MPKTNAQLERDVSDLKDKITLLNSNMPKQDSLKSESTEVLVNTLNNLREGFSPYWQSSHNGKRKVGAQFGYPLTITDQEYLDRYNRQDIANRIINAYPEACWTGDVTVSDDQETSEITEFERSFNELRDQLKLINYFTRTDKLAGLGEYSILYIGLNDGQDPSTPINEAQSFSSDDILFLKPFTKKDADITQWNTDASSPRFGYPELYTVQIGESVQRGSSNEVQKSQQVHWTRVVHVAEGALQSDTIGIPRLKPIWNRLIDLEKVVGASAELFWLNGRGGLNFNAPLDASQWGSSDEAKKLAREEIENYVNELQRVLRTRGVDVKPIQFSIPDPVSNFDVLIKLISGQTGIPQRILTGSERGELASSQDQNNFNSRVEERQHDFCGPEIFRQTVDWFIARGILPEPIGGTYEVVFQQIGGLSEMDKADRAQKLSTAIASYNNSFDSDNLIPKKQFVEEILGLEFREQDIVESDFDETQEDIMEVDGQKLNDIVEEQSRIQANSISVKLKKKPSPPISYKVVGGPVFPNE